MRIELRGIEKRFGKAWALRGIDLSIPAGTRVALVGPNGSGKSTLTRVIMGLISSSGEVRLDDLSPFADREKVARRLAYVPQIAPQLAAPVGDVIRTVAAVRGVDEQRITALAARLELDVANIRNRPFRNLSGGMKQKLLLALALSTDASLLILDEPTASLDAGARALAFELLGELPESVTLLLSSHRIEELRHLADHVVALEEGRLVSNGPIKEVLAEQSLSVIEVAANDGARLWLEANGFHASGRGWWMRTTTPNDNLDLVPALMSALGGDLHNVLIREVDSIEMAMERRKHG